MKTFSSLFVGLALSHIKVMWFMGFHRSRSRVLPDCLNVCRVSGKGPTLEIRVCGLSADLGPWRLVTLIHLFPWLSSSERWSWMRSSWRPFMLVSLALRDDSLLRYVRVWREGYACSVLILTSLTGVNYSALNALLHFKLKLSHHDGPPPITCFLGYFCCSLWISGGVHFQPDHCLQMWCPFKKKG